MDPDIRRLQRRLDALSQLEMETRHFTCPEALLKLVQAERNMLQGELADLVERSNCY